MLIPGKLIKVTKWIHGTQCVLSTEVDAIRPDGERHELCLEPHTLRFLDEMQQSADAGDVDELAKHGIVYVRRRSA